jgi:PKHD-type hydroxylase
MILEHNYYWFKSALSPETCNRIIDAGLVKMEQFEKEFGKKSTDATTFDHKQKGGTIGDQPAGNLSADTLTLQGRKKKGIKEEEVYIRDTKVSWLEDQWIYDLIHPFIHEANRAAGWNFEWDWSESCQFAKYGINNFYGWHTDSGYQTYEKFDPEVHEMIRHPDGTPMLDAFNMVIPKMPSFAGKINT